MSWEMAIILGLTVSLIALYALGSIWNRRIQRSFWRELRTVLKRYSRRVSFKSLGSSGFKAAFRPSSGPLKKVEISLVLLAREMPLYLLAAYATGRRDMMIVKANLAERPDFQLEVFGKGARLEREITVKEGLFKPVKVGGLGRYVNVLSDKPGKASELLSGEVLECLTALRGCLERFSVSRREPHVLIACRRDESAIGTVFRLLEATAEAICGPGELTRGRRGRR